VPIPVIVLGIFGAVIMKSAALRLGLYLVFGFGNLNFWPRFVFVVFRGRTNAPGNFTGTGSEKIGNLLIGFND